MNIKPKFTHAQLVAAFNLLEDLHDIEKKYHVKISNLTFMINHAFPHFKDMLFMRYEKEFTSGGSTDYEHKIAQIDKEGTLTFLKFDSGMDAYRFIGDSVPFDLNNPDEYEKIA